MTHRRRASRWASTPSTPDAVRNGSTPISVRRVRVLAASLVWMVASTMCPVRAACIMIWAVSPSRTSPIMITSGSERSIARKPAANVRPALLFTCTWLMPPRRYSTGSSTVMILRSPVFRLCSAPYRVVDLPEPVGPETSTAPYGRR